MRVKSQSPGPSNLAGREGDGMGSGVSGFNREIDLWQGIQGDWKIVYCAAGVTELDRDLRLYTNTRLVYIHNHMFM
jgi:hypothetical protein